MLVMKFGGSSVRGGRQLRAVAEIVAAHRPARPVVVASAMRGVTELLLVAADAAARGERRSPRRIVLTLEEDHSQAIDEALDSRARRAEARLGVAGTLFRLDAALADLASARRLTATARDRIASAGEGCLVPILAAVLRDRGLPARAVEADRLVGDEDRPGQTDDGAAGRTAALVRPLVGAGLIPVLGGSDLSASLLAQALDAGKVWIWTEREAARPTAPRPLAGTRAVLALS